MQGVSVFGVLPLTRTLLALTLWLALLPSVATLAQEAPQPTDEAAPGLRHAQVIANGVLAPAREIAWRLSVRQAVAPERAVAEKRSARFVLADEGVIAVVHENGAILTRLEPGEAVWTEPGARRAVVSLESNRTNYYEIALVSAAAQSAASDVAATTAPFVAPAAEALDVDLIRDVLQRNEESAIPSGLAPMLLAVTGGKVFAQTADGEIAEISAGEFVQVEGELVVVGASRGPAAFVVARVGAIVAEQVALKESLATPAATPLPQATPVPIATPVATPDGSASLFLTAHVCPVAYAGSDFPAGCPEPGGSVAFSIAAGGETLFSELSAADGVLRFSDLPVGDYTLLAGLPEDIASSWVSCRNIRGDQTKRAAERHRLPVTLGRNDHVSCDWYIIPAKTPDVARSSLLVSILACPEGMTAQRFAREACTPVPAKTKVRLSLRDEASDRLINTAGTSPDAWSWDRLAAGSYALDVGSLPAAFVDSALDSTPCCGEEDDFTVSVPTGFSRVERTLFLFPPELPRDLALTVLLRACPPGMSAETLVAELCLTAPEGTTLTLLERGAPVGVATAAADAWVWNGLAPLDYGLKVNAMPAGFSAFQLDDELCCAEDADFAVTLSGAEAAAQRTLYLFQPPGADNGAGDADADGLADAQELELGINPFLPDGDADSLADGDEVNFYGTDPRRADTDSDGLGDTEEVLTHATNPLLADTDGDGLSDRREVAAGSDPLDSASIPTTPTAFPTATATPTATPSPTATPVETATPDDASTSLPTPEATPDAPARLPTVAPDAAGVATLPPAPPSPATGSRESAEEALDGDGLPTLDEIVIYGTSPTTADSDGDGVNDGDEVAAGSDPRDAGDG